MKISVIASTKEGNKLSKKEALVFSGKSAGICYLRKPVEELFAEPEEKSLERAMGTVKSGHHSVCDNVVYNLCLQNIPKILAMILNNEKMYNTSEKSARYTKMQPSEQEKELYEKWIDLFKEQILNKHPEVPEEKAKKLAQENARYLISVFTPATTMEYTVSFRQLNYIISWSKNYIRNYIENTKDDAFSMKVKEVLKEFLEALPDLEVEGLNADKKNRSFSLFAKRKNRREEFGENYCTTYMASFAQLAQAHRHRTLRYEMILPEEMQYYVPPIIRNTELQEEWIKDISSLSEFFPQGMMVQVNERGAYEDLEQKCTERLCGSAQLETMEQTKKTVYKYIEAIKDDPELEEVYEELLPLSKGPRCVFLSKWECTNPCVLGVKNALNRDI